MRLACTAQWREHSKPVGHRSHFSVHVRLIRTHDSYEEQVY